MEDSEIINLWKTQNAMIEQSLKINQQLLKESIAQKAQSALQSLKKLKTAGIVVLVPYLVILGWLLFYAISHYSSAWNYFIISFGVIFIVNIKAFADYVKHLVWTNNINYNGNITETQEQLTRLQLSIIQHTRIMCLQFPFWTTFYLSSNWFPGSIGVGYIIFQIMLTGSFTFAAYWLYKNQTIENIDKKWFQRLIAGSGGKSVMKALAFYKEIEKFKQGN